MIPGTSRETGERGMENVRCNETLPGILSSVDKTVEGIRSSGEDSSLERRIKTAPFLS